VTAGVEGGSWDRIEDWTMARAEALNGFWRRNGPPFYVAVQAIGRALGIDWDVSETQALPTADTPAGPSIADLAAMAPVPL